MRTRKDRWPSASTKAVVGKSRLLITVLTLQKLSSPSPCKKKLPRTTGPAVISINSETELKSLCHTSIVIDTEVKSISGGISNTASHQGALADVPVHRAEVSKKTPLKLVKHSHTADPTVDELWSPHSKQGAVPAAYL